MGDAEDQLMPIAESDKSIQGKSFGFSPFAELCQDEEKSIDKVPAEYYTYCNLSGGFLFGRKCS